MRIILFVLLNAPLTICSVSRSYIDFAKSILLQETVIDKIFFVPGNQRPKQLLLGLIQSEKSHISAALFRFTDKDIAQALVNAAERGVHVDLIVDQGCFTGNQKIAHIVAGKIPVYVYSHPFSIMHHKMFLFENALEGKHIVWHGSANATTSGLLKNEECISIREGTSLYQLFFEQFEGLKNRIMQNVQKIKKYEHLCYLVRWMNAKTSK